MNDCGHFVVLDRGGGECRGGRDGWMDGWDILGRGLHIIGLLV